MSNEVCLFLSSEANRIGPQPVETVGRFLRSLLAPCGEYGVYRCMSRTNINIDDEACAEVMRRYRLSTKREAVNFALRALAAEPLGVDEARRLRGSGWEGDLDDMRTSRS